MVLIPIIEKHLVTALNSHQKGGGGGRVLLSRRKRGNVKNAAAAFAGLSALLLGLWYTYVLLVTGIVV